MNDLVKHIEKLNAQTEAWIAEDPKNRWATTMTTCVKHWAEYGIYTPEQFDNYMSAYDLYEIYADRYSKGYARSKGFFQMNKEQLAKEWEEFNALEEKIAERDNLSEATDFVETKLLAKKLNVTIEDLQRWGVA